MNHDFFDALEHELRAAVPRAAAYQRGRSVRRWLPRPGLLVAAASLGATLAVLAAAVVLIGDHHQTLAPTKPSSPGARHSQPELGRIPGQVVGWRYVVGAIPTLRQLRGNLAVLRRPKTAGDQHNPPCG